MKDGFSGSQMRKIEEAHTEGATLEDLADTWGVTPDRIMAVVEYRRTVKRLAAQQKDRDEVYLSWQ